MFGLFSTAALAAVLSIVASASNGEKHGCGCGRHDPPDYNRYDGCGRGCGCGGSADNGGNGGCGCGRR